MPTIRIQEVTRNLLGKPFTPCIRKLEEIDNDSIIADNGLYDERRCQYNNLHKKIYQKCNCILKHIADIHEFFPSVENYRKVLQRNLHFSLY